MWFFMEIKNLTLLAPRALVPTPSTEKGPLSSHLINNKCCKPKALGGARGILQGLKTFQVDIRAFVWLPWQSPLNHSVLFCHSLMKHY